MLTKRPSNERGHFNHGWLNTYHTFSFADYFDPANVHFRSLRVINEDTVAAGKGFGMHPHRDMEIVTYVLSGQLKHEDSMGNSGIIQAGDVQRMTAGTGIVHSEFNPSHSESVHLLQIWLIPAKNGLHPSYDQRMFHEQDKHNTLCRIVSHDGRNDSLMIHQDVTIYASIVSDGAVITHHFIGDRSGFLQVARGNVVVNDTPLSHGDSISLEKEPHISIQGPKNGEAEFLLFDLA